MGEEGAQSRAVLSEHEGTDLQWAWMDDHELGNKGTSGIPERNNIKERSHGLLSTPSCQRYLSVTI